MFLNLSNITRPWRRTMGTTRSNTNPTPSSPSSPTFNNRRRTTLRRRRGPPSRQRLRRRWRHRGGRTRGCWRSPGFKRWLRWVERLVSSESPKQDFLVSDECEPLVTRNHRIFGRNRIFGNCLFVAKYSVILPNIRLQINSYRIFGFGRIFGDF